jgi:hypothetical protein
MDFDSAIPRFESWRPSHPVRQKRESPKRPNKSPPFVDFSTTANSLHVPKLGKSPASSPKVSTESLNYSRFLESPIGDYFDRRWVPTWQSRKARNLQIRLHGQIAVPGLDGEPRAIPRHIQ